MVTIKENQSFLKRLRQLSNQILGGFIKEPSESVQLRTSPRDSDTGKVDSGLKIEISDRVSTPYVDRLLDVYRHGLSEADQVLSQTSEDPFLWDTYLVETADKSVEVQKNAAWAQLVDYIGDLRPGMLSDAEVVSLVQSDSLHAREGREVEYNLMSLPKEFFPVIEHSKKFEEK